MEWLWYVILLGAVVGSIYGSGWLDWMHKRGGNTLLFGTGFFSILVAIGYFSGRGLPFPAGRWVGLAGGVVVALWLCRGLPRSIRQELQQAKKEAYLTEAEQAARARLASREN